MIGTKWLFRIGVIWFMLGTLILHSVGVLEIILWTIGVLFAYLFWFEYGFLSILAGLDNPGWFSTANTFYREEKVKMPYLKYISIAFFLMLTETYKE